MDLVAVNRKVDCLTNLHIIKRCPGGVQLQVDSVGTNEPLMMVRGVFQELSIEGFLPTDTSPVDLTTGNLVLSSGVVVNGEITQFIDFRCHCSVPVVRILLEGIGSRR